MENSFNSLIGSASSVLILLPSNPNLDIVAAGLGLYLATKGQKETNISCPTPMVVEFNRLVGVNKITSELGNKNLTIKFTDYKASDIERVSYDIENGEFRLTVIPKPGLASPKQEQVTFSYSGVAADTVILVGGTSIADFPNLSASEFSGSKLIHIGTRAIDASGDKTILSFDRPGSSISEIVAALLRENGFAFDLDTASNLLTGIWEGSRELKGEEVNADTFEMIATLMRTGAKIASQEPMGPFPQGSVPGENLVEENPQSAPKDWLEPKIYKGTSIS